MFVLINFRGVLRENILTIKFCHFHIIEITVHVLWIMTSYLAIAPSLLVLQRQLNAVRLHTGYFFKYTV